MQSDLKRFSCKAFNSNTLGEATPEPIMRSAI